MRVNPVKETQPKSSVKIGDKYRMTVVGFADRGETFGFIEGMRVYLPYALPGEKVQVQMTERRSNFARAKLLQVFSPAKGRVEAPCVYFDVCGGCQWQHLDYTQQLMIKQKRVKEALEAFPNLKGIHVKETLPSSKAYYYRNKAQQPVVTSRGEPITGFYYPGTHRVVPIDACRVQPDEVNAVIQLTMKLLPRLGLPLYHEKRHEGSLRHILVRMGFYTHELMLVLVTQDRDFKQGKIFAQEVMRQIPEVVSVIQNINAGKTNVVLGEENIILGGKPFIEECVGEMKFRISPKSFFQVNTDQALRLCETVLKYADLQGDEEIVDLYAGVGLLGLFLARKARKVYGVESVSGAIEDARLSAELNQIQNVEFFHADALEGLKTLSERKIRPSLVVLDPPRQGCGQEIAEAIHQLGAHKIIVVSCDLSSFVKDLQAFSSLGYQVKEIQPIDLFPQTYHVECVALLEYQEGLR